MISKNFPDDIHEKSTARNATYGWYVVSIDLYVKPNRFLQFFPSLKLNISLGKNLELLVSVI